MKDGRFALLKATGILASLAAMVAAVASNTACIYWFHQPQAPAELKTFTK